MNLTRKQQAELIDKTPFIQGLYEKGLAKLKETCLSYSQGDLKGCSVWEVQQNKKTVMYEDNGYSFRRLKNE